MNYLAKITKASLGHIIEEEKIKHPIVQLIAYKHFVNSDGKDRYRLTLSDSIFEYKVCLVLDNELIERFSRNEFDRYCLIKLIDYHLNIVEGRKIIIVDHLVLYTQGCQINRKIGSPSSYGDSRSSSIIHKFKPNYHLLENAMEKEFCENDESFWNSLGNLDYLKNLEVGNKNLFDEPVKRFEKTDTQALASGCLTDRTLDSNLITPISSLKLDSIGWTIAGRVIGKSPIKSFNKNYNRPKGCFFLFEMQDSSGVISVVAFGDQFYKFYSVVNFDECYLMSGGKFKVANKRLICSKSIKFEITCTPMTVIENFENATISQCPPIKYEFCSFSKIRYFLLECVIDIIGILVQVNKKTVFKKSNDAQKIQRKIGLVDKTMNHITVTLWDNYTNEFAAKLGDVILIKNLLFDKFKTLSTLQTTVIKVNPCIKQKNDLKNWYDSYIKQPKTFR